MLGNFTKTRRRGEFDKRSKNHDHNYKYQIVRATSHDYLFIIVMRKVHTSNMFNDLKAFQALYSTLVKDNVQCQHHIFSLN